jgi:small nuclear ribonucleoprotein (snRNP)-like protein
MSGYEKLIGRRVTVVKNDGFRKYGDLKSIDASVLVLIFENGKEEYIPLIGVAAISLDEKASK